MRGEPSMSFPTSLIDSWIAPNARVLDLGCGDGALLEQLTKDKNIRGYGLEIDAEQITQCVSRGVNVIEQNLDKGLSNFADNSFDTVVMTQTLQAVHYPDLVLDEMLRIGKECLVSFPNFGYWRTRLHLFTKGKMPVSNFMPYTWYDTPNIHFCTVNDFEELCHKKAIRILNRRVVNQHNESASIGVRWPNLFGATAIYRISK